MRLSHGMIARSALTASGVMVLMASSATGQLPSSSPTAFGMAGNYTAIARGYEAVAFNPANLASPGRPFISFGTGIVGTTFGLEPVDLNAFYNVHGTVVDSATRASWIDLARQSAGQKIRGDANVTPFALSVGPIGLQLGVAVVTNANLSPDAFEAAIFGNAGNNNGQPKTLDLTGTEIGASVFATGAASFALPLPLNLTHGRLPNEHFSVGITGKYVISSAFGLARDAGSTFSSKGVIDFPMIALDTLLINEFNDNTKIPIIGSGMGADLGLAWSAGRWRVGVLAENIFNSFKWDTTKLAFTPNTGSVDPSDSTSELDSKQQPFSGAPQTLRDEVIAQGFKPGFTVGMALKVTDFLTITGDFHKQLGGSEAISIGPRDRVGVGAELRILPFVPLRAGVASVTDGWQAAAGFGIRLLGYELGVSGSIRRRGAASESGLMVGVVGIGH